MANQIFHFSNTGISSGQKYYLKDDVSGIFVRNLNIHSNFPIVASNLVYNTGDQTINGIKNFTTLPTVNSTGVLLTGQNIFTLINSTSQSNLATTPVLNAHYYFSFNGAGYSSTRADRLMPILEKCVVRKAVIGYQQGLGATPGVGGTGYLINATQNMTGIISTIGTTTADNNFYSFTNSNLNIPFSAGDSLVFSVTFSTTAPTNIRSQAIAYFYN